MSVVAMDDLLEATPRLSLLDDEHDVSDGLARSLRRKGFEVTVIEPTTPALDDTVQNIMNVSDAALCDHALSKGMSVSFSGADVVVALHDKGFPAVLFTGVQPEERYAIRRNMAKIPGFLHRDHEEGLRPERVLRDLADSVQEVGGGPIPQRRRPRRTPVTVTASRSNGSENVVSLLVSGWPGRTAVEAPADLLAEPWREHPQRAVGKTFFACVNIGEDDEQKLFFKDFESQPATTDRFIGLADE